MTLNYIKENYVEKFPDSYLMIDGKPLLTAFNPIGMMYKPSTDDFVIKIVGNDVDHGSYRDWDLWPDYDVGLTGSLRLRDGYVALSPRFDDEAIRPGGIPPYDRNLDRGWYVRQWEWVLANKEKVSIIAIYSWNEYHERSAIEPHFDATSDKDPMYLYNLTKHYISLLKEAPE